MLEASAIQHCPVSEWGGFMLEAMAIQHALSNVGMGGIVLEAMAIQHCPVSEWGGIILVGPMCGV